MMRASSGAAGPVGVALAIDLALLSLFAVQHSGMARPGFKRVWTKLVPQPAERATYVLLSTLALVLLFAFWQPIAGTVWQVTNPIGPAVLQGVYFFGWALLLFATALIDHFDLFGLRQAWLAFRGRPYVPHPFETPSLYRHIRHPIYVAWAVIFWATPEMSLGHLLFAGVATTYMVLAVFVEERDLVHQFGDAYRRYQETVPKYVPRLGAARATAKKATA
jgi:protein-S-isoprenylcysteine O-methyltransferase Ste14